MEIELAEIHAPSENSTTLSSQPKFAKDEAVLARFGKRQQLRVCALHSLIAHSRMGPLL